MQPKTYWTFGIINNRLAEVYYKLTREEPVILGHCYVKKTEYKTKREQLWIKQGTQKFRLTWKLKTYKPVKPKN